MASVTSRISEIPRKKWSLKLTNWISYGHLLRAKAKIHPGITETIFWRFWYVVVIFDNTDKKLSHYFTYVEDLRIIWLNVADVICY